MRLHIGGLLTAIGLVLGLCSPAPASAQVLDRTGDQRTLVILAKYADRPLDGMSRAEVRDQTFGSTGITINTFVRAASQNRAWVTGDVTPWLTMTLKTTDAGRCSGIAGAAFLAAAAGGYDVTRYSQHVILVNASMCTSDSAFINGYAVMMVNLDIGRYAHEFLHGRGLYHSHDQMCMTENGVTSCRQQEYGEDDVMSAGGGFLPNAFQAERLGWRTPLTVTQSGTYFLEPYATASGGAPKALKIALQNGSALYVEHRTATGVDYRMWPEGVKLHTGTLSNGNSSLLLDMDRQSSVTTRVLAPGRSYEIPGIVRIETLTALASGADIRVTFLADPAPPPVPTLTGTVRVVTDLQWVNLPGTLVDILQNGAKILTTDNDGLHTVNGLGTYQVCSGTVCTPAVSVP